MSVRVVSHPAEENKNGKAQQQRLEETTAMRSETWLYPCGSHPSLGCGCRHVEAEAKRLSLQPKDFLQNL